MNKCIKCGGDLGRYGIGATKKFINRGATEFCCVPCIAKDMNLDVKYLEEKIEFLKKHGCTLFP